MLAAKFQETQMEQRIVTTLKRKRGNETKLYRRQNAQKSQDSTLEPQPHSSCLAWGLGMLGIPDSRNNPPYSGWREAPREDWSSSMDDRERESD